MSRTEKIMEMYKENDEKIRQIKDAEKVKTGWRMYFFVMYNLSGIQKGIQAAHAALEYARAFGQTSEYEDFIDNYKTFILLDGGGSQDMVEREKELEEFGVKFVSFQEPDLNNSVSAISFLVPEGVYAFAEALTLEGLLQPSKEAEPLDGEFYSKLFPDGYTESQNQREKDYNFYKYLKSFRLASN